MKTKLTIYQDESNLWRWRVQAANNEIIAASSEGFSRKASCIENFEMVTQHIVPWYQKLWDRVRDFFR